MEILKQSLPFASPFISSEAPSMADVLDRLDGVAGLSPTWLRDLKSAIRSIARLIGRRPEELPANINWLHIRLRRVQPAEHDLSKKRFANIKSDALKALEMTGCSRERSDWLREPTPAWQTLFERIIDKHDQWKLTQLAQYCSALGIEPTDVTDQHIVGLQRALTEESFINRPEHVAINAAKTWNRLRQEIEGWPDIELSRPPLMREPWTLPLETFSQSFQDDVARWIERLRTPDPLNASGPLKPVRPSTLKHRRFQIRELASALVHTGHSIDAITSLATLVELGNFKDSLRWMMGRFADRPTEAIHGLAVGMTSIAHHHVNVGADHLKAMKGICQRLNLEADGLREKNRARLLQLEDPHNLGKLLHLPAALVEKARRSGLRAQKAALIMQAALAIDILLFAPMRIGNLAGLHLEKHLRSVRIGREKRTQILIPGDEVKNGRTLHYELGAETTELLALYLKEARPALLRAPSDYLFPAQDGGPKATSGLSNLIKAMIRAHTGLTIHAHLFRSIAGKLHSMASPGDFITLSHVLSDSLRTTMKAYGQFEQKSALDHYQRSVDAARSRLKPSGRLRKHPR